MQDSALPWRLLHNGNDFFCLRGGFARLALSSSGYLQDRGTWDVENVLLVGSNPSDNLNVEAELRAIRETLEVEGGVSTMTLLGADATKANIVEALGSGEFQVLYFAGHSIFNADNPNLSYLLTQDNRQISADELGRISGIGQIKLAFLGSCSSSAGSQIGMPIKDLASAIIGAGVPYVIGMAWPVSDRGAIELGSAFYRELVLNPDPVYALQAARRQVGESFDWADPVWAAPILMVS